MAKKLKQSLLAIKRRRERERTARVEAGKKHRRAAIKGLIRKTLREARERDDIVQALFKAEKPAAKKNLSVVLSPSSQAGRNTWVSANLADEYIKELEQLFESPHPGLRIEKIVIKRPDERHATTYNIANGVMFKKQKWAYASEASAPSRKKKRAKSSAAKKKR